MMTAIVSIDMDSPGQSSSTQTDGHSTVEMSCYSGPPALRSGCGARIRVFDVINQIILFFSSCIESVTVAIIFSVNQTTTLT